MRIAKRFSLWSKMLWAEGPKGCAAANLVEGQARSGALWLTPAGTTPVRLARGGLLPCFLECMPLFQTDFVKPKLIWAKSF